MAKLPAKRQSAVLSAPQIKSQKTTLFALALIAKDQDGKAHVETRTALATNKQSAEEGAKNLVLEVFPPDEGYDNHTFSVIQITVVEHDIIIV